MRKIICLIFGLLLSAGTASCSGSPTSVLPFSSESTSSKAESNKDSSKEESTSTSNEVSSSFGTSSVSSSIAPSGAVVVDVDLSLVTDESDFRFILKADDTYEVAAADGFKKGVIRIPSSHNGKAVTSIAAEGFVGIQSSYESPVRIRVPGSVKTIGEKAFFNVKYEAVFLEEGVEHMGSLAFGEMDDRYTDEWPFRGRAPVFIPSSLNDFPVPGETFMRFYFGHDLSAGRPLDWPKPYFINSSDMKAKGNYGCSIDQYGIVYSPYRDGYQIVQFVGAAKELTFPTSFDGKPVYRIHVESRFQNCFLEKMTIPDAIHDVYFTYLSTALREIEVPDSIESFAVSTGDRILRGDNPYLSVNEKNGEFYIGSRTNPYLVFLGLGEGSSPDTLSIAEGCRVISGRWSSSIDPKVHHLVLPDSLCDIGQAAFAGWSTLEDVTFPKSKNLKVIGERAFAGCRSLTSFHIPYVEEIKRGAFFATGDKGGLQRSELDEIIVEDGLRRLEYNDGGDQLSYRNPRIANLLLPDTVEYIATTWLESISRSEFPALINDENGNRYLYAKGGKRLALVTYKAGPILPCPMVFFGYDSEGADIDIPEGTLYVDFPSSSSFRPNTIVLADTVKHFDPGFFAPKDGFVPSHSNPLYAFYANGEREIPNGVVLLASRLSRGPTPQSDNPIQLPNSLRYIGCGSFGQLYCETRVPAVTIPAGVLEIEDYAFSGNDCFSFIVQGNMNGFQDNWCPEGCAIVREN